MRYIVELLGREAELELGEGGVVDLRLEGEREGGEKRRLRAELRPRSGRVYSLILEGKAREVFIDGEGGRYRLELGGWEYEVQVEPAQLRELRRLLKRDERPQEKAEEAIVAHIPGLVVEVKVREGQEVEEGQGLVVIEAMKMENEVRAPCSGVVEQVGVRPGEEIQKGQVLCRIKR